MEENICRFVQTKNASAAISILHFVYEKEASFQPVFLLPASYCLCLVTQGSGCLHTRPREYSLEKGTLFFIFPAKPYYIENFGKLNYIYISFIGSRVTGLFERLNIRPSAPVYPGYESLIPRWSSELQLATEENIDLVCESLLLHTLSFFCSNAEEPSEACAPNGILRIKQYVDLHYTDCGLDLKFVSDRFNYHPKYVSAAFAKLVRVPFSKYLRELRLHHAQTLLQSGVTSVHEVAKACGYSDAFYFSKLFSDAFGISPKNYQKHRQQTQSEQNTRAGSDL